MPPPHDRRTATASLPLTRRRFGASLAGATATAALPTALPTARTARAADGASWNALAERLDGDVADGTLPGFVALAARGEEVWTHVGGVQDLDSGVPMRRDSLFPVASIGKPLTAAAALTLVEEGTLALDAPVDPWLPELADRQVLRHRNAALDDTVPAARPITLRDLLTQQFGLGALFADPAEVPLARAMQALEISPGPRLFGHPDDVFLERLGGLPLAHQPGDGWLYHTGLDVAGVLIARAAGADLDTVMRQRLYAPLGMVDTGFQAPWGEADRLITNYWYDPETGTPQVWNAAGGGSFADPPPFQSGGGGHVATADDYLAFGRMLLGRGRYRDRTLLSAASIAEMTRDQIAPEQKDDSAFFPGFWRDYGWGLGGAVTLPGGVFGDHAGAFG